MTQLLDVPAASRPLTKANVAALHRAHSALRDIDGLHADKALDELCKILFVKLWDELRNHTHPVFVDAGQPDLELTATIDRMYAEARKHAFGGGLDAIAAGAFGEPVQLSLGALRRVVSALSPLALLESSADIKGAAFQRVLSAAIRNGMGQYFTPEPVVDCVVQMIRPGAGERVLDPFCGSGRFLTAASRFHVRTDPSKPPLDLHGIEKSDRMVRIALTEVLIDGIQAIAFHRGDSLLSELARGGDFDVVLTNPPFGSLLEGSEHLRDDFELARLFESAPLEVLGLELCAKALRRGGRAAIVLPESILNTRQMQPVRDYVLRNFNVLAVLSLPPQTFAPFEGVGKASVLFLERNSYRKSSSRVFVASPEHVGYDNTGRHVPRNDLPSVVSAFEAFARGDTPDSSRVVVVEQKQLAANFSYSAMHSSQRGIGQTILLGELCTTLMCGCTPPKSGYTEEGARILKVGDLTGAGLNWEPRERAFVDPKFLINRRKKVEVEDLLVTAAAHHPKYIGQKVDIVDYIPAAYASQDIGFVSELLLIRVDKARCDPYMLLMWLRSPEGYNALQSCVAGQTGHLYPEQAAKIQAPKLILKPTAEMQRAVAILKRGLKHRRIYQSADAEASEMFNAAIRM